MKRPPAGVKLKSLVEHLEEGDLVTDTLSLGPVKFMGKRFQTLMRCHRGSNTGAKFPVKSSFSNQNYDD